jgi:hypothetical protein
MKLKLDDLKVKSFVTSSEDEMKKVKGGTTGSLISLCSNCYCPSNTDCGDCESVFCPTWDGAGCHTQGCSYDCPSNCGVDCLTECGGCPGGGTFEPDNRY